MDVINSRYSKNRRMQQDPNNSVNAKAEGTPTTEGTLTMVDHWKRKDVINSRILAIAGMPTTA